MLTCPFTRHSMSGDPTNRPCGYETPHLDFMADHIATQHMESLLHELALEYVRRHVI